MSFETHAAPLSTADAQPGAKVLSSQQSARELIARLHDVAQMRRTGVLLLGAAWLGQEKALCARLGAGIEAWDYARWWRESLSPHSRFLAVSPDDLLAQLADWARDESRPATVAVFNFDLPLAFLSSPERARFWNDLLLRFPKTRRAILVMLPAASPLGPDDANRVLWEQTGRLQRVEMDE